MVKSRAFGLTTEDLILEINRVEQELVKAVQLLDGYNKLLAGYILENGPMTITNKSVFELPRTVELTQHYDADLGATIVGVNIPD